MANKSKVRIVADCSSSITITITHHTSNAATKSSVVGFVSSSRQQHKTDEDNGIEWGGDKVGGDLEVAPDWCGMGTIISLGSVFLSSSGTGLAT